MSLPDILLQVSIWSVVAPLTIGCVLYKYLDAPSRIVLYLVMVATIPQLLTIPMDDDEDLNVVYNIYTLIEFGFFYLLFGRYRERTFKRITIAMVSLFFVFAAVILYIYGWRRFLNELVCAEDTICLVWIFMFILRGLLTDQKIMRPALPMFWFIAALILFIPCTIFVLSVTYYIKDSESPFVKNLWVIHDVFNTLMYLLFAVGLYKNYALRGNGGEESPDDFEIVW